MTKRPYLTKKRVKRSSIKLKIASQIYRWGKLDNFGIELQYEIRLKNDRIYDTFFTNIISINVIFQIELALI